MDEPHSVNIRYVARNTAGRRSAVDRRTTRNPGWAVSQHMRKRIEERPRLGQGFRAASHSHAALRARRQAAAFSAATC